MSAADKIRDEHVEVQLERLFAGREPSEEALARWPTLQAWTLDRSQDARGHRGIVIRGTLASGRFTVKNQPRMPVPVIWMDRKFRFALTTAGLWNLGEREKT